MLRLVLQLSALKVGVLRLVLQLRALKLALEVCADWLGGLGLGGLGCGVLQSTQHQVSARRMIHDGLCILLPPCARRTTPWAA